MTSSLPALPLNVKRPRWCVEAKGVNHFHDSAKATISMLEDFDAANVAATCYGVKENGERFAILENDAALAKRKEAM